MNTLPSTALEYREGSSDKVYRAAVEAQDGGYVVNFAYGRRGSALNAGTKTASPVTLEEAVKVYEKLVKSKTAKGYKPVAGAGGNPGTGMAAGTGGRVDTGLRAQLLCPVDADEAERVCMGNDWICMQEKFDGRRMLLRKAGKTITADNRHGIATGCPQAVHDAFGAIPDDVVIDGECVGDVFYAFDLLEGRNGDRRNMPYGERIKELTQLLQGMTGCIVLAETAFGEARKREMLEQLREAGREGAVFKDMRACWSAGRPASGGPVMKLKFWASCSCLVKVVNGNRRSVALTLLEREIGNVTIPANHAIPEPGQVVEVRYLYVTGPEGNLYQPVYLGLRDDVAPDDCTLAHQRLKIKAA